MKCFKKTMSICGVSFLLICCGAGCQDKENRTTVEKINPLPVPVIDTEFLSIDKSPMDMSYFPKDYPKEKMITSNLEDPVARVIYSRPQKKERIIFADTLITQNFIQHYGREWRLGANEATEIEFFKNVTIGGKHFSRGRYILYCIPYPDKWKLIFNSNLFSWGLHIDRTKDIAEIELPVMKNNANLEFFTMVFQNASYGCDLVMAWGDVKVIMPITFN
jgi:hypothetical protein